MAMRWCGRLNFSLGCETPKLFVTSQVSLKLLFPISGVFLLTQSFLSISVAEKFKAICEIFNLSVCFDDLLQFCAGVLD